MRNFYVIAKALESIEENLCEELSVSDVANACYISVSGLQKIFNIAFTCSVGEYISKRRLSKASYELVNSERSITEIAFAYRYKSPEVFLKAFKRFWGVLPSEYRKNNRFSELFPKFQINVDNGGIDMDNSRKVDVSNLYDELKKLGDTYVLCVDICKLKFVNDNYGYAAGDLVIAETARRIDSELTEDMMLFRIGRDEFAVVTAMGDLEDAQKLALNIINTNGKSVVYNNVSIPVSVRIGISKLSNDGINYKETLDKMFDAINKVKAEGAYLSVLIE